MEKFLIHVSDILSKFDKNSVIHVLGNGTSKLEALNKRDSQLDLFIQINTALPNLKNLFVIATRQELLLSLEDTSQDSIIVAPKPFQANFNFVRIPISESAHLEGLLLENHLPTFRFDFVLITILEILQFCANQCDAQINVNLAGFDMMTETSNLNKHHQDYLEAFLNSQKNLYKLLTKNKKFFPNLTLEFENSITSIIQDTSLSKHAKLPPKMNIEKLNKINNSMLADALIVKAKKEPVIIAELTNNHLGDTSRLIEMVDLCISQGADVIKIQKREPDYFYTKSELNSSYSSPFGDTLGEYRNGVELSLDQIKYLHNYCVQKHIPWFSSVLDLPSYNKLNTFNLFAMKIPSTISQHRNFISTISKSKTKMILVSTGATTMDYVNWIINLFESKHLVLMQCTSSYPCESSDCNIKVIDELENLLIKNRVNATLGYSSHDMGELASQLALALGAKIFEKHIKLGSIPWVHFDSVALDLKKLELAKYVEALKIAKNTLGSGVKTILPTEHHKYKPNENHY
jgi:N-acetylneuraminate synthase